MEYSTDDIPMIKADAKLFPKNAAADDDEPRSGFADCNFSNNTRYHTCLQSNDMCNIYYLYGDSLLSSAWKCFEKKYRFDIQQCSLPSYHKIYTEDKWQEHSLQMNKTRLNNVKKQLNDFDLISWHKHTSFMNPASSIIHFLKRNCGIEFLTQAWCKFYEIADSYPIIPQEAVSSNGLISVHLCEAPGAFVASLNHYLKTKTNIKDLPWDWIGSTLNPFYEGNSLSSMINDDRLILNTLNKWDFGYHMTGDIFDPECIANICRQLNSRKLNKEHLYLVTADGSLDCSDDPGEQEIHVTPLYFVETLVALRILRPGGVFILKIFTIFECDTICLLYILCCAFKEVNMFKPCTSKEGNSECYLVCIGFKGLSEIADVLNRIQDGINNKTMNVKAVIPYAAIPGWFLSEAKRCSDFFTEAQISVIERNINLYQNPIGNPCKKVVNEFKKEVCQIFLDKYDISSIQETDRLVPFVKFQKCVTIIETRKAITGFSFSDKKRKADFNVEMRIEDISSELKIVIQTVKSINDQFNHALYKEELDEQQLKAFKPVMGEAITGLINSSQFCYGGLLRLYTELRKLWIPPDCPTRLLSDVLPTFEEPKIVLCDVSDIYLGYDNNNLVQHISFLRILRSYRRFVEEGSTLIIEGLPLITHFNVSLAFVLRYAFEYVKYEPPSRIVYYNATRSEPIIEYLIVIKEYLDLLRKTRLGLLYFVPIELLREITFYSWVVNVNNQSLEYELRNMVDDVQNQIKCKQEDK